MPNVIYSGDIVENFGRYVPTPYIEKIDIETDQITTRVCIFLASDDYDENEKMKYRDWGLTGLYVYLLFLPGNDLSSAFRDHAITPEELKEIMDNGRMPKDKSIFKYFRSMSRASTMYRNYARIRFSEFEDSGEIIYDDEGKPIRKFTYETDEPFSDTEGISTPPFQNNPDDLVLFAFSSYINYNPYFGDSTRSQYRGFDLGGMSGHESLPFAALFGGTPTYSYQEDVTVNPVINAGTSDIAYESIFTAGILSNTPTVQYTTINGDVYNGIPLIDLSYRYHVTTDLKHQLIVNNFKQLLNNFANQNTMTKAVRATYEQINYVLSKYGTRPELLLKLSRLQTFWSNKSRGTPLGKLYVQYQSLLASAYDALAMEAILTKTTVWIQLIVL
jgi:hypothetical protein